MNETATNKGLGMSVVESRGELSTSAAAARAKAEIEARFVIALNRPRNILAARAAILDACKRPAFAAGAMYRKPVGKGQTVDGLSIRFAETAIQAMRNISVTTTLVYEDDENRAINISVTDLESNLCYGKDVTISKTVERRQLKEGQNAIAERTNSTGQKVYIVAATDDEIANKIAAAESKVIRNSGLRLVPADILEEAEAQIQRTLETGGADPQAEAKRIVDAFGTVGVTVEQLQEYLGHAVGSVSKKEMTSLRMIFAAVRDGEAKFGDYLIQPSTPQAQQERNEKPVAARVADEVPIQFTQANERGETQAQPAAQPARKEKSPQETLADAIINAGGDFDAYCRAITWLKLIPMGETEKWTGFHDVHGHTCNRHMRVLPQIIAAINEDKGGAK